MWMECVKECWVMFCLEANFHQIGEIRMATVVAIGVIKFSREGQSYISQYSKHLLYTVAHTTDCVCSKMLNHGLNNGLFLSLLKFLFG